MEVIERSKRILGPYHKDTMESKFNHAYTLSKLGKIKEAEALYLEIIFRSEKALGPDNSLIRRSLESL